MDDYSGGEIVLIVVAFIFIVGGVSNFVEKRGFGYPVVFGFACGCAFLVFVFGIIDFIRIFILFLYFLLPIGDGLP